MPREFFDEEVIEIENRDDFNRGVSVVATFFICVGMICAVIAFFITPASAEEDSRQTQELTVQREAAQAEIDSLSTEEAEAQVIDLVDQATQRANELADIQNEILVAQDEDASAVAGQKLDGFAVEDEMSLEKAWFQPASGVECSWRTFVPVSVASGDPRLVWACASPNGDIYAYATASYSFDQDGFYDFVSKITADGLKKLPLDGADGEVTAENVQSSDASEIVELIQQIKDAAVESGMIEADGSEAE